MYRFRLYKALSLLQFPFLTLTISFTEAADDGKTKNFKTSTKKGGVGFGTRKALNDITNKSSVHHEASSRKKNLPKEDFDIAEEMFLHDHKKCFEAQQAAMKPCFLDTVLPGHGNGIFFA